MENIITYEEYLEATEGEYSLGVEEPKWFNVWQTKAVNLMRKKIAQVHLFPRNRTDYLDLRTEPIDFQTPVRNAIAEQTRFMHDNEITILNGYMNTANSFTVGNYNQSMTPDNMVRRIFNELIPVACDNLEQIGWMYSSLETKLDPRIFYKGEN